MLYIFCKASTEIVLHFLLFPQAKLPASEIAATIDAFRTHHLAELTEVHIKIHLLLLYCFVSLIFVLWPLCSFLQLCLVEKYCTWKLHISGRPSLHKQECCFCVVYIQLSERSGTSLGYGFSRIIAKPKVEVHSTKPTGDDDGTADRRPEGGIVAVP